ncbi:MAG: methionyl-tRNA formyltransferase-like protein, partial [Halobacteriaceae archaeon]
MDVCVLTKPFLPHYQVVALENIASLNDVRLRRVVVDSSVTSDDLPAAGAEVINEGSRISVGDLKLFITTLREKQLRAILYADEKAGMLFFGERSRLDWLQTTPVEDVDCLTEADIEYCEPNRDGAWMTLPNQVVERVAVSCNVCVRFGFGLIEGGILDATEFGVISAHGSDIRKYRGLGPIMTLLQDDEEACLTIQQLSEEIDGGNVVIMSCEDLPANPTLDDVRGELYEIQT